MTNKLLNTLLLQSNRVVTPAGVRPAKLLIVDGVTLQVLDVGPHSVDLDLEVDDLGDLVISPGVIDAHVHINDPGSDWEGFESATHAAAAGGVTTLVDMPLNSLPVTTTVAALKAKQEASSGKLWVDVGLYGGLVQNNADQMQALCQAGVLGVKCFLCHSGLDEFPNSLEADLRATMPILAKAGVPLLVHAELLNSPAPAVTDPRSFAQFVASRPEEWELDAIELMIDLCRETGCHVHIVHLATGAALAMLAIAKRDGLPITVETCPHYLFFENTKVADGDTRFKCAPPIREGAADLLFWGLQQGIIDTIGSDHSPCPPAMKHLETGDFSKAWGGIASLQLTLPAVWTFMNRHGCDDLELLAKWLSSAPANLVGLQLRKGQIAAGFDADLVVWDPDAKWQIKASELFHRHPVTPYDGCEVTGKVLRTYVRGQQVFRDGHLLGRPLGKLLKPWRQGRKMMNIAAVLNELDEPTARDALQKCCAAPAWFEQMLARRPFAGDSAVETAAAEIWNSLPRDQWLAAFAAHPKIGDPASLRAKYANTSHWANSEQAGVAAAAEETLQDLAEYNQRYEQRFGYIFIVCATGKSAAEMLALLQSRITNDPDTEIRIAATEQLKITLLRLKKLANQ